MARKDQGADADKHDESRDDDALLVGREHAAAVGIFILAAFGDEDGVVVALTEDEGGQDDVDHIELYVQKRHEAQDPQPADGHGEEGDEGQLDVAERGPEEEENDEAAGPSDIVEVVGKAGGQRGVDLVQSEDVGGGRSVAQLRLGRLQLLGLEAEDVHDAMAAGNTVADNVARQHRLRQRGEALGRNGCEILADDVTELLEGRSVKAFVLSGFVKTFRQLLPMTGEEVAPESQALFLLFWRREKAR